MKTMMKILALVMAMVMVAGCLAACGGDSNPTEPEGTTAPTNPKPTDPEPTDPEPTEDGKVEYKVFVKNSEGNPVSGVLVQICKEGSTCFTPSVTDENGCAVWRLEEASDYYGTFSSLKEGIPKEYFSDKFEVTLVYDPSVIE